MAFASVGSLGTVASKSAGTTRVITTTATAEAGNLVVVATAWDNSATTDVDTTQLSVTDSAGNTYTRVRERNESAGSADDGTLVALFYSVLASQLNSGGTITVTNTSSETAAAAMAHEFTLGSSSVAVEATAVASNQDAEPADIGLAGMTSREYLLVHVLGQENNNSAVTTFDTDYTAMTGLGTTGGGAATNQRISAAYRIATLTADTATGLDLSSTVGGHVSILAAIYEDAGGAGDTLTAGGAVAAGNALSAVAPGATGAATAQGNTLSPSATATAGGALAQGNEANQALAALTQGGATAAGNDASAAALLTVGGAVAGGNIFDTEEGDTLTPGGALAGGNTLTVSAGATVGGGLAQGNTIAAAVPVTGGSANAQGNEPTPALALLTAGGAIAGGNTITEEGDTLTPGGAVAQGNTITVTVTVVTGGSLAQGNTIAAAVPVTGGSANAQGNEPSPAVALLTTGGAIAAGNILIEDADVVTGRLDRATPGGRTRGSAGAAALDRPTPGGRIGVNAMAATFDNPTPRATA